VDTLLTLPGFSFASRIRFFLESMSGSNRPRRLKIILGGEPVDG
jgi:hypothetical protein